MKKSYRLEALGWRELADAKLNKTASLAAIRRIAGVIADSPDSTPQRAIPQPAETAGQSSTKRPAENKRSSFIVYRNGMELQIF